MNTGKTEFVMANRYPLCKERVQAKTITQIFRENNISYCNFMKIDIEGADKNGIYFSPEHL